MHTSSVHPRRTSDPVEARRIVEADECVILTGLGTAPEDAVAVAHSVFGADVLQVPEPSEVRAGGDKDRRPADLDNTKPGDDRRLEARRRVDRLRCTASDSRYAITN